MAEIDFPPITGDGQTHTDQDGSDWIVYRGAWARIGGVSVLQEIPTGSLVPYCSTVPPQGYLYCNGQAVSRTTYADLFGILGETFGAGDGSTTFNVPDLRGRVVAGIDDTAEVLPGIDGLGEKQGVSTHTLTTAQMPNHTHAVTVNSGGSHSHSGSSNSTGSHSHSTSTGSGGASHNHGITIRSLNQNAGGSNSFVHGSGQLNTWSQTASHTHSASTTSTGAHSHTITVGTGGDHSHTTSVTSVGSDEAFPIIQPLMALIWLVKI